MPSRDHLHPSSFLPDLQSSKVGCILFRYGTTQGYDWDTYTRKPRRRSSCFWFSPPAESSPSTYGGTSLWRSLKSFQMSWTILRVLFHCSCVTFTHTWSMLVWITVPAQFSAAMEGGRRFLGKSLLLSCLTDLFVTGPSGC
jgi:hypothetical protein